nr:hypothetical protein [Tanacetum cinerariifolium]
MVVTPNLIRGWFLRASCNNLLFQFDDIDEDEEITFVNVQDDADKEMFDVNVLDGEEVFVTEQEVVKDVNDEVNVVEEVVEVINTAKLIFDAAQVSAAGDIVSTASIPVGTASVVTIVSAATTTTVTITIVDDITLAQALKEIKIKKSKEKGINIQEVGKYTLIKSSQQSQDKAAFDEEERLAREKAKKIEKANIVLIETWDDIQAKIDADHQLAERMQAQEQKELSIAEKATLFQQLLEKRRKHFAAKRAEEKRNKPPTKAQ